MGINRQETWECHVTTEAETASYRKLGKEARNGFFSQSPEGLLPSRIVRE